MTEQERRDLERQYKRSTGTNPVRIFDASIILEDKDPIQVGRLLIDTGSEDFTFVSPKFIEKNAIPTLPLEQRVEVRLGDNATHVAATEYAMCLLSFPNGDGTAAEGYVKLLVMETGYDIIVGIKDIMRFYTGYLCRVLTRASETFKEAELETQINAIFRDFPRYDRPGEQLLRPFDSKEGDSEEELAEARAEETVTAMHWMSKPIDELRRDFFDMLPAHIPNEELRNHPIIQRCLFDGEYIDVFFPSSWPGIDPAVSPDVLPVRLKTLPNTPTHVKPSSRPIPYALREAYTKEMDRMCQYFFKECVSNYASPQVVAAKATEPFIRIAGDYRAINVFIERCHWPVPLPDDVIRKVLRYKYLLDIDARNGYHNLPLSEETSLLLAVQGLDRLYRPLFLPEGVGPASGYFQKVMLDIFDGLDFVHVIMDNLIVGADSIDECAERFELVLKRARKARLVLKMEKTWLGVTKAKFFGYEIGEGTQGMDEARVEAIRKIPLPTSKQPMQRLLGCSIFFQKFVPDYATIAAPLTESTKNEFDWNDPGKVESLRPAHEALKVACANSVLLFDPDPTLPWILRTDASILGAGGLLLQQMADDHPKYAGLLVPLFCWSQKFSAAARRWSTYEQELFAIFWCITKVMRHLLYGKYFICETDHRNLQWMQNSEIPKVVRWRLALQQFDFSIRHIKGTLNVVPDFFSRIYLMWLYMQSDKPSEGELKHFSADFNLEETPCHVGCVPKQETLCVVCAPEEQVEVKDHIASLYGFFMFPVVTETDRKVLERAFYMVHNGREGHHGIRRTYQLLCKLFPDHRVSIETIRRLVQECPVCQKVRDVGARSLEEQLKALETTTYPKRGWVGIDVLGMPESPRGNSKLTVFVNINSKRVRIFVSAEESAVTIARHIITYTMQEGRHHGFTTDKGSNFIAEVNECLFDMLGMHHKVALTGQPTSSGVESTNKSIIRHLKALLFEKRGELNWDLPEFIEVVCGILNEYADHENGIPPNDLTYGNADQLEASIASIRTDLSPRERDHEILAVLSDNIKTLRVASEKYHREVIAERLKNNPEAVHEYVPGDLVLFRPDPFTSRAHKLTPSCVGPFEVESHDRGTIVARHVCTKVVRKFHVSRLVPFIGSKEEAFEMAQRDDDQYLVIKISKHRGDPLKRSEMEFFVEFDDGDKLWIAFSQDLWNNECFQDYCSRIPYLKVLTMTSAEVDSFIKRTEKEEITEKDVLDLYTTFYLDIKGLGVEWYQRLHLPNSDSDSYYVLASFDQFKTHKSKGRAQGILDKTKLSIYIPAFDEYVHDCSKFWLKCYAYKTTLSEGDILIDSKFLLSHPFILGEGHPMMIKYQAIRDKADNSKAKKSLRFHLTDSTSG